MRIETSPDVKRNLGRAVVAVVALAAFVVVTGSTPVRQPALEAYQYLSPTPGSRFVSPANNVVIRDGRPLDPASVTSGLVAVTGVRSGAHDGDLALSDDGRTLVFRPRVPFARGESVEVTLQPGIRTEAGAPVPGLDFGFEVADISPRDQARYLPEPVGGVARAAAPETRASIEPVGLIGAAACDGLPPGFPDISVLYSDHPEPGDLFLSPWIVSKPGHLVILDNLGMPLYDKPLFRLLTDFKVQPNGLLTYYDSHPDGGGLPKYFVMDSTYAVVDSFECGNGYVADNHELQILPDGHALLMAYDPEPVDMNLLVVHGDPDAIVTGLIVQELDASKHVVFQWRSWDHFKITDASPTTSLTEPTIDYVHGNSLELDHDGNILLSSRHLNEVTKIDRQTGAIIWRFGPHAVNNQFTVVGDPRGFSQQHDARRLSNGHLTLFDNGVFLSPQYSRALEYELDEVNKVATLVWEYRETPDVFGVATGNTQRRPSGGTTICWGGTLDPPKVTDVHADGTKAFEIGFTPVSMWTYRAFRFPWRTTLLATAVDTVKFGAARVGDAVTRPLEVRNGSQRPVTIGCAVSTDPAFAVTTPLPVTLAPGERRTLELSYTAETRDEVKGKVYLRMPEAEQWVAQDVWVTGGGNAAPEVGGAVASAPELWPPDHGLVEERIEGVSDPDGDPVTITVTGVTQDEAVLGEGSGSTCPDAEIEGDVARVRAERSGSGNGRAYRIAFRAEDGRGGEREGFVTVRVPHDRGKGDGVVDDGQVVNALGACRAADGALATEPESPPASGACRLGLRSVGPAGSRATVEYTLAAEGRVQLSVYDLSGRRVRTLVRGTRSAGSHRLTWDTAGLTPGMYFYRLRAGGKAIAKRVPLLK